MAIRKRSALLLGLFGFISGVLYAQCQRRSQSAVLRSQEKIVKPSKPRQIPMQVVDETLSTARQNRNKAGYTTH